eukprot:5724389-Prymnesium_polylepis.1
MRPPANFRATTSHDEIVSRPSSSLTRHGSAGRQLARSTTAAQLYFVVSKMILETAACLAEVAIDAMTAHRERRALRWARLAVRRTTASDGQEGAARESRGSL